jgi:uncharacterized protein YjbI with pentapeptide repeats
MLRNLGRMITHRNVSASQRADTLPPRHRSAPEPPPGPIRTWVTDHWTALIFWTGLVVVVFGFLALGVIVLPRVLNSPEPTAKDLSLLTPDQRVTAITQIAQARNAVRTSLIQAVGGTAFLLAGFFAWRQLLQARQGQQTERFSRSIEQIASEKEDVRLGGVYSLGQLSKDKLYTKPVAEVLVAFLRTHGTETDRTHEPASQGQFRPRARRTREQRSKILGADVQAAADILISQGLWAQITERPVDLSNAHLPGIRLPFAMLNGAVLSRSELSGAELVDCSLRDADLREANLSSAEMRRADLTGAWLHRSIMVSAHLQQVIAVRAKLQSANMSSAELTEAQFTQADLSECLMKDANARGALFRNASLVRADLSNADLSYADLSGANLTGANLTETKLDKAKTEGADFTSAKGWEYRVHEYPEIPAAP